MTDIEREQVRSTLAAIVEGNHGILNPRQVLDEARRPDHALHAYFEWDDGAAGEAYRLLQVGALVRRVKLTIIHTDQTTREVTIKAARAYQSRPSQRHAEGGYEPLDALLRDDDKRGELIAQVLRELNAHRRRYAALSELQPIWTAVDDVTTDLLPSQPSSPASPTGDDARHGTAG